MTDHKNSSPEALDRLADTLVEETLKSSDEEILCEIREHYGDPTLLAESMRDMLNKTILQINKKKLLIAKDCVSQLRQINVHKNSIDRAKAKKCYENMLLKDPETAKKLTMAARKGNRQTEHDINSALDDLADLGAFVDGKNLQ